MRITLVTLDQGAGTPEKAVLEFAHDSDALSEIWRLLASRCDQDGLLDLSWERADGVVLPRAVLARWARQR